MNDMTITVDSNAATPIKSLSHKTIFRIKKLIKIIKNKPDITNNELMKIFKLKHSSVWRLRKLAVDYRYATREEIYPTNPKSEPVEMRAVDISEWLKGLPEEAPPKAQTTITELDTLLNTRHSTYGTFMGQASLSQAIKKVINERLKGKDHKFEADQLEALSMIAHKIARVVNGDPDYVDSWRDIAGYAQLVADRLEGRVR